jgi:Flp pilus assembly protein TadD
VPDAFHHQRVLALLELRKYDPAAREARLALQQDPDNAEAHRLLAFALWRQGKEAKAERTARTALGLAASRPECHGTLAYILSYQGRHEEAEMHYQKAIALAPWNHMLHYVYAEFYLRTRQWAAALEKAGEALCLAPRDVGSLSVRAGALCNLGRLEEADETVRQALALRPDWSHAHHVLGHIQQARGEMADALSSFRESLRLEPTNQPYKRSLARAVGTKLPILGLLWRRVLTLKGRRRLEQIYRWIVLLLFAWLVLAAILQIEPVLVWLSAIVFGALPWLMVMVLRLVDRTLTAAVMRGWIK